MKLFTNYFATESDLFKHVDDVLKQNGLYGITPLNGIYMIEYFLSENCRIAYTVLKGRENKPFKLTLDGGKMTQELFLETGDVLYLSYQRTKKAWFYCPKALIGKHAFQLEDGIGFTAYGTVKNMIEEGLIKSNLTCDISTYFSQLI